MVVVYRPHLRRFHYRPIRYGIICILWAVASMALALLIGR
jgi:hypothetical protein